MDGFFFLSKALRHWKATFPVPQQIELEQLSDIIWNNGSCIRNNSSNSISLVTLLRSIWKCIPRHKRKQEPDFKAIVRSVNGSGISQGQFILGIRMLDSAQITIEVLEGKW